MNRKTLLPIFLACAFCLSAPVAAQQYGQAAGGVTKPKPLNLSQPHTAASGAAAEQDTAPQTIRAEMDNSDSLMGSGNDMTESPYGTGFEARQRRFGRPWQGGNAGMGSFGGGHGRGKGR